VARIRLAAAIASPRRRHDGGVDVPVADKGRSGQPERGGDLPPHRFGREVRRLARCLRDALEALALGKVQPAMVGAENDRIIHSEPVDEGEEAAEVLVEVEELQAHLCALGAVAVADIIGRREADREEVGAARAAEPHLAGERRGHDEGRRVELGGRGEVDGIARGAFEPPGADRLALADRDRLGLGRAELGKLHRLARLGESRGDVGVDRSADWSRGAAGILGEMVGGPIPALVGGMAAHHHRGAVLAGDGDHPRRRVDPLHPVAERRHAQMVGRDRVGARIAPGHSLVLGAIDPLVGARHAKIVPGVGDDPGARRVSAGEQRRVARAGFGRRVRLIAVGEDDAVRQALEPAGEMRPIFGEQLGRELVDRDRDDQLRPRRRRRCGERRDGGERRDRGKEGKGLQRGSLPLG
jgi:hypothetical protein